MVSSEILNFVVDHVGRTGPSEITKVLYWNSAVVNDGQSVEELCHSHKNHHIPGDLKNRKAESIYSSISDPDNVPAQSGQDSAECARDLSHSFSPRKWFPETCTFQAASKFEWQLISALNGQKLNDLIS